jgi:hypothetical protein
MQVQAHACCVLSRLVSVVPQELPALLSTAAALHNSSSAAAGHQPVAPEAVLAKLLEVSAASSVSLQE